MRAIADFLENTFQVGVVGFGLHKKVGDFNENADLDSCRKAHEWMSDHLEKLTEKIKDSFIYQVPAKLNGPQHSVSAVTVGTVKMAARSFAQLKKNVELVSDDTNNLTVKVNPSSTTTKSVEHFHSLSHRKKTVQNVQEYVQSWAVIVREYVKSLCSWSFQMFSGFKSSYYLRPEESRIPLRDIPMMPKLPSMNSLSNEQIKKMEEVCMEHKALPQSSTRCFTSKFKAGTLPLQAYFTDDLEEDTDEDVEHRDEEEEDTSGLVLAGSGAEDDLIDEPPEWDSESSDEEDIVVETADEPEVREGYSHHNQQRVTRSGRRVIAAKHYMFDAGSFTSIVHFFINHSYFQTLMKINSKLLFMRF